MFASPDTISLARTLYWKKEMLDEFVAFVGKDGAYERVLDAGCSVGYLTAFLADRLNIGSIVGIDINPQAIDIANKQKARIRQKDKITYQVGDLLNSGFEDDYFDLVFAHHLFIDVTDVDGILSQLVRVLKPGGVLCCIEPIFQVDLLNCYFPPGYEDMRPILQQIYQKMIVDIPKAAGLHRSIAPSMPKRLKDVGIRDVEIKVHADYVYSYDYDQQRLELLRQMATQVLAQAQTARQMLKQHPLLGKLPETDIDDYVRVQVRTSERFLADPKAFVESGMFSAGMHIMVRGYK